MGRTSSEITPGGLRGAVLAAALTAVLSACSGQRAASQPGAPPAPAETVPRALVRPFAVPDTFGPLPAAQPSPELTAALAPPPTPPLAPADTAPRTPVPQPTRCAASSSVSIMVFPAVATDSPARPSRRISGPSTSLCTAADLALGPVGELVVVAGRSTIAVHDREANGDAPPRRTLAAGSFGLAVASDGSLFATTEPPAPDSGSVTVYDAGAAGDVLPLRTLTGGRSLLTPAAGLAVGGDGSLYVALPERNAVAVYADGADGERPPVRVIQGPRTGMLRPVDVALDGAGNLYVANAACPVESDCDAITVYAPGASGDVPPSRAIRAVGPELTVVGRPVLVRPEALVLDAHDSLYVGQEGNVLVYAPAAAGPVLPRRWISGKRTGVYHGRGLALDGRGTLYIVTNSGQEIAVFEPGADGDAAPARRIPARRVGMGLVAGLVTGRGDTLYIVTGEGIAVFAPAGGDTIPVRWVAGPRTGLSEPRGIAVGRGGELFVSNGPQPRGEGAIRVYAAGAEGTATPVRTLTGTATRLFQPTDVAFDSRGDLYVVNAGPQGAGLVTVYDRAAHGNTPPKRVLTGATTYLRRPIRLAFGAGDTLYVLNAFSWWKYGTNYVSVTVYSPGASGDAAPTRIINVSSGRGGGRGRRLGLNWPEDIAVGRDGSVYVSNYYPNPVVAVYAPGADGDAAPVRVIGGRGTPVTGPRGLALDARGELYVANVPQPAGF